MSKLNGITLILLLLSTLVFRLSEECKCPKHMKGSICGGVLRQMVKGNGDCKYKTVYKCSGSGDAAQDKSCGDWPCVSRQDLVTAEVIGSCFPKYKYVLDHVDRKIKLYEAYYGK